MPLRALEDSAVGLFIGLLVIREKQLLMVPYSVYFLMGETGPESYSNMVFIPELSSAYPQVSARAHVSHD